MRAPPARHLLEQPPRVSGLLVGSLLGIVVGLFTGRVLAVRLLLEPVIQVLRPIPGIAWIPFAILWFGVGEIPKLFIISLGVFFPVWLARTSA